MLKAETHRFWRGFAGGAVATLAMTGGIAVIWALGASSMPEPIPLSLLARLIARALQLGRVSPAAVALAIPLHLAYGGLWGGLLALSTPHVTWWKGAAIGLGLWLIMLIFMVPLAGVEAFHVITRPLMWFLTLLLHLIYGVTLGLLVDRHRTHADDVAEAAGGP